MARLSIAVIEGNRMARFFRLSILDIEVGDGHRSLFYLERNGGRTYVSALFLNGVWL